MEQEFWLNLWQLNDIKFNQTKPNKYLQRYLSCLKLKQGSTIFVPLCGKSIDMLWLAQQGFKIIGIELSEIACRDFFVENNLDYVISSMEHFQCYESENIKLYAGDFFKLDKEHIKDIEAVFDRAALVALPKPLRASYVKHLIAIVPNNIELLLITAVFNQLLMPGPPFSVEEVEIIEFFSLFFNIKLLYDQPAVNLPSHLIAKGLNNAQEKIYHLENKLKKNPSTR